MEKKDDGYLINGRKIFISNGSIASLVTVFASHDTKASIRDSWSCFAVPTDTPGFSVGQIFEKMGQRASPATVAAGVRALVPGGRLVAVGVGMMPPHIDLPQAIFSFTELSVIGSFGSHKEDLEEVFRLEATRRIDIESSITHRLPLDAVAEGLEMLRTKKGDPQRIVVEFP